MSEEAAKTPFKTRSPKVLETREIVAGQALKRGGETVVLRFSDSFGPPRQTDVGVDEPQPAPQTGAKPEPAHRPRRIWSDLTMSALEGGTDEQSKRGRFRF
jgi:hypothetical protein